jgi:hypothetical protein
MILLVGPFSVINAPSISPVYLGFSISFALSDIARRKSLLTVWPV